MPNEKEIAGFISGDVDSSKEALETASHDASIFEIKPQLVVRPRNSEDLKKLVKYVSEKGGMSLTARSAGTDMSGGPLTESIVVEFTKYFNNIIEVGEGNAITQPGVYYRDFDKATKEKGGQIMPSYPASRELCTVGGIVSNNSGGEKTLTYGKTERYIRRLKVVLADGNEYEFKPLNATELEEKKKNQNFEGEIYRNMDSLITENEERIRSARPLVSKNSCGYYLWNVKDKEKGTFDLTKLIAGSQGTLGMVTEVEFALVKPKLHSRLLVVFLTDLKLLADTAMHILKFQPESFESYDDHTFKIAVKFLPQLMRQMGGNLITLGLEFLPEMMAVIEGGVPKLVLMAEFTADTPEEAVAKAEAAKDSIKDLHEKAKVTTTARDANKYWIIRRESFNMLRHHVKELRTAPFIDDFAVLPARLPEFLPKLYSILDQYNLTYTIAGHVGDGNFHIIPLMNLHEVKSHEIIKELSVKVYELVHEFAGTITAEHNDGMIRTPFIKMQYGEEVYKLFEETKKIWDPKGIFNPGKKVGGTLEYAFAHIIK
ncbi:MAG: FAD-binding oxidoreductase [Candidatus Paceibacterota bacterium]